MADGRVDIEDVIELCRWKASGEITARDADDLLEELAHSRPRRRVPPADPDLDEAETMEIPPL